MKKLRCAPEWREPSAYLILTSSLYSRALRAARLAKFMRKTPGSAGFALSKTALLCSQPTTFPSAS